MQEYYIVKRGTKTRKPYLEITDESNCAGRWTGFISPKCLIDNKSLAEWFADEHHGQVGIVTVSEKNAN